MASNENSDICDRIKAMLAPELTVDEFRMVRQHVCRTVAIARRNGGIQPEDADALVAALPVHDVEKFRQCKLCGNNTQVSFVCDHKNGCITCTECGAVAAESLMHKGPQFRTFEGEADRNTHGDAPNPLLSNSHNTSTSLGANFVPGTTAAESGMATTLRRIHNYTEINISKLAAADGTTASAGYRRTRVGYKDNQKKQAFLQMNHVGYALDLHEAVIRRAKEWFSDFRDDRESVQQYHPVLAACLCEAYDRYVQEGQSAWERTPGEPVVQTRTRLADLVDRGEDTRLDVSKKPVAEWDLFDCRSWLMEVSRPLAEQWIRDRRNGVKEIPNGSQEELEGKLAECAFALGNTLESELVLQRRSAGQLLGLKTTNHLSKILGDKIAGDAIHKKLRVLILKQRRQKGLGV